MFAVKRYGRWTEQLVRQLSRRAALPVRVTGPLGHDGGAREWEGYPSLLLIGGGVGVRGGALLRCCCC